MRVLIVEDARDMNRLIAKTLKKNGYSVDCCFDGEEALDYIAGAQYDALILDIMIPKMDGYVLLQKIRSQGNGVPVLFLTARDSVSDRVKGLDLGADDYLVKPFDFEELLARIRAMTRKQAGTRSNLLSFEDLIVNIQNHTVMRGDTDIQLLPKEFAILEYMLRNQGAVLSREQLENQIWNYEYAGSSNNIDGYMSRLRKKLTDLEQVTKTAAAINEARDLTGRIGLPEGKDEFSQLAVSFDGMFERLERSFEVEKQFTTDASHELRTPVSIIKGACEYALKYDESPKERQETIAMIHRQSEKMASIISQLLNMTRLEQGTEQVHMDMVDVNELVRSVCSEQYPASTKIHCGVEGTLMIKADGELLSRLLRNLIENAVKYGKPDGNVWISTGRMQGEFFLSVRDDGIGISPEQQKHIWNRFYQADPARSGDTGAGLGLSMVRQIALLHGGYMSVESVLGEGSEFIFHLSDFM